MMDYQKLRDQLRIDEGVRYRRYIDTVGKVSIGIGHNITDDKYYPYRLEDEPLSAIQVDVLLNEDIAKAIADLDENANWWRAMEEPRQRVLANMCFNLGWPKLSKFVNTLNLMHCSCYQEAADAMRQSLWYKQVGARAERLCKIMETGKD